MLTTDKRKVRELWLRLRLLRFALRHDEPLNWAKIGWRTLRLVQLLERVEDVLEVEKAVLKLIRAVRFRNAAAAWLALEVVRRWWRTKCAFFDVRFTSGGDARSVDRALPVRFTQAYYLAACAHWRMDPVPPPGDASLVLWRVRQALLVDVYLPRRWSRFVQRYDVQRLGGNLFLARDVPILVTRAKYDPVTVDAFLRPLGHVVVSPWRRQGELYYAVALPLELAQAQVPLFACDFRRPASLGAAR